MQRNRSVSQIIYIYEKANHNEINDTYSKAHRELLVKSYLVPKKNSTVPITSNLGHIHGALNAVKRITNYTV